MSIVDEQPDDRRRRDIFQVRKYSAISDGASTTKTTRPSSACLVTSAPQVGPMNVEVTSVSVTP